MAKYRCKICGYIYDDEKENINFLELPDNWVCPLCLVGKDMFELVEEEITVNSNMFLVCEGEININQTKQCA